MPRVDCVRRSTIQRTPRVMQLEGMFDVPRSETSEVRWSVNVPLTDHPWHVGLIVGPSGCGKSTLAAELFGEKLTNVHEWPHDQSVLDGFPAGMGVKEITQLLSSVGFSSPPSWLRPYHVLSNGERFRVDVARSLASSDGLAVVDEFTSVVDRQVAQVGSYAVAKTVRLRKQKFVAVACHYDIVDWLDPDWILEPHTGEFQWRLERRGRPEISLEVIRVQTSAWKLFKPHHYLSSDLHRAAKCFMGLVNGTPAAFVAVLPFPHATAPGWREHRCVVLPDYQGAGLGNAFSEYVASLFACLGKPYRSATSHPGFIHHRNRSRNWKITRKPGLNVDVHTGRATFNKTLAHNRMTATCEYVGPKRFDDARLLGVR